MLNHLSSLHSSSIKVVFSKNLQKSLMQIFSPLTLVGDLSPHRQKPHSNSINQLYHHRYLSLSLSLSHTHTHLHTHTLSRTLSFTLFQDKSSSVHLFLSLRDFQDQFWRPCPCRCRRRRRRRRRRRFWGATIGANSRFLLREQVYVVDLTMEANQRSYRCYGPREKATPS